MCNLRVVQTLRLIESWMVIFFWMSPCCKAGSDGTFECGAHGRFEYCIDGIPGCVTGCHCHPGYYFDTESKICEPNTKLTSNYRRYQIPQRTRIQVTDDIPTESLPILTTHNIIDQQVNDIAKNADDLGDWLYNQFFKTIENQVINNTNNDSQLTRRSSHGILSKPNNIKRRMRRKGSRHKKKEKGFKEKLLRIAEDDSLFQSSESSADSASRISYNEKIYNSFEADSNDDHGHKKILLINKKPRPPLPSFIFLPNMNTPFYPPIGLPPPPVMPMYPMVPVPPMMPVPPFMPPFQGNLPDCEENTTLRTESDTAKTVTTSEMKFEKSTKPVSTNITTTTKPSHHPTTTETLAENTANEQIKPTKKLKKKKTTEKPPDKDEELPVDVFNPNRKSRQNILNYLRQRVNNPKMNNAFIKEHKEPFENYMNQLIQPETFMDTALVDDVGHKSENLPFDNFEDISKQDSVDFKYLSELIHRVKENNTQQAKSAYDFPKPFIPPRWSKRKPQDFKVSINSGRRNNLYMTTSRTSRGDDSYYTNLGRQIATLIRTIDADKEKVEIEKVQRKTNYHPYFNENGPRTFWERSVRSPLTLFNYFNTQFEGPMDSNELLYKIENKVETVVSTEPPLTLHEIENLINIIEDARSQFRSNNVHTNANLSVKSLNVNLWSEEIRQFEKTVKSTTSSNNFNIKRRKDNNDLNISKAGMRIPKINIMEKKKPFTYKGNKYKLSYNLPMQKSLKNITKLYSQPLLEGGRILRSPKRFRITMNPTLLNYKNIKKYFVDDNNRYSFQNDDFRLNYLPAKNLRSRKSQIDHLIPSPYFRQ